MRPSLPPDMGDNAAAQATLEARLRREQIKRVSHVEDLANVVGNASDGQALVYSQTKGAWTPGGNGKRFSTVTVAAHDAVDKSGDYDYVCTGTNDELTINAACTAAVAAGNGAGRVLLSEGNFNLGTNGGAVAGIIQPGSAVLEGMGSRHNTTTLNLPTGMATNQIGINSGARVAHIDIEQGTCSATGVILVVGLDVDDVFVSCNLAGTGATIITCSYRVRDCVVSGGTTETGILLTSKQNIARDNNVSAGVGIALGPGTGSKRMLVRGNIVNTCPLGGIVLSSDATDCIVHDNHVSQCGNGTHDGISVSGTRNSVQTNMVRKDGDSTGSGRYGINVLAGATDNLVTNNDLKVSGATGSFNDAGTGTITAAGNRL